MAERRVRGAVDLWRHLPEVAGGMALVALLLLRQHIDGLALPWLVGIIVAGVGVLRGVQRWTIRSDGTSRSSVVAIQTGVGAMISYATGWGPALLQTQLVSAADNLRLFGSSAVRPVLAWSALWTVLGQVAIGFDVMPSYLPTATAHVLAGIGTTVSVIAGLQMQRAIRVKEAAENALQHQASHDSLTGLVNRDGFYAHLEELLDEDARGHREAAVLYVDLDGFKQVNDTLGHATGDAVLKAVADRLQSACREADLVARLGGDEFAVLLADSQEGCAPAEAVAERLLRAIRAIDVDGFAVPVAASIGIVRHEPGHDADELVRRADLAMYTSKAQGKGSFEVFHEAMLDGRRDRLRLDLKRQLSLGWPELDLYYQPIVDLNDGAVVGFESLLRWHHPDRGAVSPGVFVPLAEESGVIAPLGRWVLERATRQLRAWQDAGPAERMLTMSVNVSARQLGGDRLIEDVRHALEASGVAPQSLTLELTESALVADPHVAAATLGKLEQLGVRMAIDDFGTGYSSLSYLQRFPVDVLKIDRTFVRDADRGARQRALFRAIVELAHALDLQVVAEGIERSTEVELCQQVHCRFGQGFLFARPLPADEARRLMPSLPQTEVCKDPVDTRMVPTSA